MTSMTSKRSSGDQSPTNKSQDIKQFCVATMANLADTGQTKKIDGFSREWVLPVRHKSIAYRLNS